MLYRAFSLFIVGGSPHLVSENFPWHKWENVFFWGKKGAKLDGEFKINF